MNSQDRVASFFEDLSEQTVTADYAHIIHQSFDWKDRLEASGSLEFGHAAPGGRYTQALFEAVQLGKVKGVSECFEGQIVVELGAGCGAYGITLAQCSGAKGYVGIEAFYSDILEQNISSSPLPKLVIGEDMLSALQRLPDASVSILACGIEDCILPDPKYKKLVEDEARRVLHPSGALVCSQSDLKLPEREKSLFVFKRESSKVKDEGCIYFSALAN